MSTRQSIVEIGDELLRSRGYSAFSYSDISKRLGIKNAAIHYHFPTKADLILAIIDFHRTSFKKFEERSDSKDPMQQIKLFLNFYTSIQVSGKICVIGAFATDWNSISNEAQTAMNNFTGQVISWLTNNLQNGLDNNFFTLKHSAESEALGILTNIFGATQLARITGTDHFTAIKQNIIQRITP